jgi:hypothetical protein
MSSVHAIRRAAVRAAVVVTCALAFAAGARADDRNLLINPGFEDSLEDHAWMPAGWDTSRGNTEMVFFGRDAFSAHTGRYGVSVANASAYMPLWHNWSQTVDVTPDMWSKDMVLTIWTKNNGVDGRGYVGLQAYRDTVGKMARVWKVARDTALARLGLHTTTDPYAYLGAKREYFSDNETEWVRRQVRVFIPPSTNLIIARCGLFGTGQVLFDDASLTVEDALPAPEPPVGVNLLEDPGFEESGDRWEYSLPPYNEMRCDRDTTVAHSGKASVRFMGGTTGFVKTRAGVAQLIGNRNLAGKRLRLTGWVKCDSLKGLAYIKLYCTTLVQDEDVGAPQLISETTPWTQLTMEMDVPKDAYQVWAWLLYNAPAEGRVYFDDASLVVLGPASGASQESKPAATPVKPPAAKKPAGATQR